jgi:thiosulfate/3-mercaptopyruvate sulfurtransferase
MSAPALVSTEWLAKHLGEPDLRVVDGTWHMPQLGRDARAEYAQAHIPGAVFFDIDRIADRTTALPHMLPTAETFAAAVGALGIGSGDRVIVYDVRGVVSAARGWWTFRAVGHDRVAVLDGGLRAWKAEGRALEAGEPAPPRREFRATLRPELVRDLDAMRRNLSTRAEQVLDARSRGRFEGTEPEPRAGLRGGHIPGSLNLPYETLYRPDGTLLPSDALRSALVAAGVDLDRAVTTTCGSGVTASVLALALHLVGHPRVAVYDGSWTEWAGSSEAVEMGGAPRSRAAHQEETG